MHPENYIGEVIHYFNHIGVAIVRLEHNLSLGDLIWFYGVHTDFGQEIDSMQIDHRQVRGSTAGQAVAVKVNHRVRIGDALYHVDELPEETENFEDFELYGR